jgi:hypothetical protein
MSYEARPEFDLQELINEYGLGGVSSVRKAESCGPDDQPTILVAEFQDLLSQEESEHAWLHSVTESHLDELYATINRAGGTSYRPNNIPSPLSIPSIPTIGMSTKASPQYLSCQMREYWSNLIPRAGR